MTSLSQVFKILLINNNIEPHYKIRQIGLEQKWIDSNRIGHKRQKWTKIIKAEQNKTKRYKI